VKVLVSALEPSSNLHLRELLKHINSDEIEIVGIFDKNLGTPIYDISEMAIMGVVDAIKKLRWFFKVADEMVALAKGCDKVLLMDSSGFNLPLAKKLKKAYPNLEIIYYILPQVWVTRAKRVAKLELYCDKLLGILPFEIEMYKNHKALYVGHPLLDEIHSTRNEIVKNKISFLAGSRASEISRLMPVFREVINSLPNIKPTLVIPSSFSDEKIAKLYGDISGFEISRDTHQALRSSEFAFICSGTATLEAALIGTPFVLVYKAKAIDFFIATKIFGIKQIGLANIILGKHNGTLLHEEIAQDDVTAPNLIQAYHKTNMDKFSQNAKILRDYLSHGSSKNVAKIIMLQKS
jgi:lipid-A-disaccharide synthase